MNEILYQIVVKDSDLIKDYPDKVNFISQREDMSDGILYNDYDFKNHRYIKAYVSNNFNIYDRLEEKDKQLDKYKNVIDKIKEIINNNAFFDPAMPNCMALGQKSTLEIKELLEEVE